MKVKFYKCETCGKVIAILTDSGVPTICCGHPMKELVPGTTDGAAEKHVPVVSVKQDTVEVTVGSVAHPMTPEHFIDWIAIETDSGIQIQKLNIEGEPKAVFPIEKGASVKETFAYCNLHGLWKA